MSVSGRVSIIIPSFNYANYIGECIRSVCAQSYQDWEAIIVDDGSTDNTEEVVRKLLPQGSTRLSYIKLKNGGVSNARNAGIERATGEYILPLDADDMLMPGALEEYVKALQDPHVGFAYSALENFNQVPGESEIWHPGMFIPSKITSENVAACSSMWRRSLWDDGVKYRQLLYEDWDLWLQIVAKGFRGAYVPKPLFRYRMHNHGRHTLNKHRYFQAYLQEVLHCPTLYSSDAREWAQMALVNAPRCFDLPSVVLLPSITSAEGFTLSRSQTQLLQKFIHAGHFTAALANFQGAQGGMPGFIPLNVGSRPGWDTIDYRLYMLGREVIVLSGLSESENRRLRRSQNVFTVVSINGDSSRGADCILQEVHGEYKISESTAANVVEQIAVIHQKKVSLAREQARNERARFVDLSFKDPALFSQHAQDAALVFSKLPLTESVAQAQWCVAANAGTLFGRDFSAVVAGYISEYGQRAVFLAESRRLLPLPELPPHCEVPDLWLVERSYGPIERSCGALVVSKHVREELSTLWSSLTHLPANPSQINDALQSAGFQPVWIQRRHVYEKFSVRGVSTKVNRADVEREVLNAPTVREQAQILCAWGDHLLQEGDNEGALHSFENAKALYPEQTSLLGLSRSFLGVGHIPLASHFALLVLWEDPANQIAQQIMQYLNQITSPNVA